MNTGAYKTLRRQDVTFEEKDQALRDDVRALGAMVGELIREQAGEELFEMVENARLRSIRRREGNEKPGEELVSLVGDLDPDTATQVVRSFATYFQMVNTAEKVHRIRRRRDYLRDVAIYQPGGLEAELSGGAQRREEAQLEPRLRVGTVPPRRRQHAESQATGRLARRDGAAIVVAAAVPAGEVSVDHEPAPDIKVPAVAVEALSQKVGPWR